jgi:hypothetical protein
VGKNFIKIYVSSILSPFGKGGRGGILRTMERLMIYKISPDPSLPKKGINRELC